MNTAQRQTFFFGGLFILASCLAMFQIMKLDDRIQLLELNHFSELMELKKLEQSMVDLRGLANSHEEKHHKSVEEQQATPAAQTADSNKLLKMIEEVRASLMRYVNSDVVFVEFLNTLDQNDPRLIQHIKDNLLITPAPTESKYAFSDGRSDFSEGQVAHIRKIFKNMTKGYFVECGGCDGQWYSNTIPLERELGWQGVLIEADPQYFNLMLKRKRKVWTVPTCLSLKNKPTMVSFDKRSFSVGRVDFEKKVEDAFTKELKANSLNVHCMPFTAIMKALDKKVIDVFSLDVEGHELDIMTTIPWDKFDIKVIMVEHFQNVSQKAPMKKFMLERGYKTYGEELNEKWAKENFMFVKISSNLI